jgi:hypothetical protein
VELRDLPQLLERLERRDPSAVVTGSQIEVLFELEARLEAVKAGAFVSFEERGEWGADGAQTAATWVRTVTHRRNGDVARVRGLGMAVRTMPLTEAAWLEGAIAAAHVAALATLHKGVTKAAFERDEELLVGFARDLTYAEFEQAVAYWRLHADPDGSEKDADAAHDGRHASVHETFQGARAGQFLLGPVEGEIFETEFHAREDEQFEKDWAEAKERLGRDPKLEDLARTPDQRRADALVEMAIRSASTPPGAQRPRPLVTFLVGFEHYARPVCELASGKVVTPGTVAAHLSEADLERALFRSPRRVEISATSRLFTGATRRAIEVRDGKCRHPFCNRPAPRCQADHIIPVESGGPTIRERGAQGAKRAKSAARGGQRRGGGPPGTGERGGAEGGLQPNLRHRYREPGSHALRPTLRGHGLRSPDR